MMPNLEKRMDDAEFNVHTPLCNMCKNKIRHGFDNAHPERPTATCKVLGTIPRDIEMAKSLHCRSFNMDFDKYQVYKDTLPSDFEPTKV